jgi:hypothetical protein
MACAFAGAVEEPREDLPALVPRITPQVSAIDLERVKRTEERVTRAHAGAKAVRANLRPPNAHPALPCSQIPQHR